MGGNDTILIRAGSDTTKPLGMQSLVHVPPDTILPAIETELSDIKIRMTQYSSSEKYTELITFIQGIDKIEELKEIRLYLLTELQRIVEQEMASFSSRVTANYLLNDDEEKENINEGIAKIQGALSQKIGILASMESIGYADYTGNTREFERTSIPSSFTKYGKRLPEVLLYKELYPLIEYVGLMILQKEYENIKAVAMLIKNTNLDLLQRVFRGSPSC